MPTEDQLAEFNRVRSGTEQLPIKAIPRPKFSAEISNKFPGIVRPIMQWYEELEQWRKDTNTVVQQR